MSLGSEECSSPFETAILEKLERLSFEPTGQSTDQGIGAGAMVLENEDFLPEIQEGLVNIGILHENDVLVKPLEGDNAWESLVNGYQTEKVVLLKVVNDRPMSDPRGNIEAAVLKSAGDVDPVLRDEKTGITLNRDEVLTMRSSNAFDNTAFMVVEGGHFEVREIESNPSASQ